MPPIRCAIVGVGNCASALVQGVHLSAGSVEGGGGGKPEAEGKLLCGVAYPLISGYAPSDLIFVCAWDVDLRKVGLSLNQAIFAPPNCCFLIDPTTKDTPSKVLVRKGPVLDGVAPHMLTAPHGFRVSDEQRPDTQAEVVAALRAARVDVLINYLPVGSTQAAHFYASCCLEAKVSLCNCIPVFIASDRAWEQRFRDAGLPLIGDDMKSQFGSSIVSQILQECAFARGVKVESHVQQNSGGNTDFLNMSDKTRLVSKKISKENVLRGSLPPSSAFLHAGPSDYISHLGDTKIAHISLIGEGFGGAPITFHGRLEVEDSPNSAGVVIDAVRFLQAARDLGISGSLRGASAFT